MKSAVKSEGLAQPITHKGVSGINSPDHSMGSRTRR